MFVTLEGPEGAGKSTVARRLVESLERSGRQVLLTREPGSGPVGERLRSVLLEGGELDRKCELFLFLADRSQHVATLVRPALLEGRVVVCDRFTDSTVVYQGHARGLDLSFLRTMNAFATGGLNPDLTLLLDLDPETGISRLRHKDRLDSEPLDFHRRVREGFLEEANREPNRWAVIDASGDPENVFTACWNALSERL